MDKQPLAQAGHGQPVEAPPSYDQATKYDQVDQPAGYQTADPQRTVTQQPVNTVTLQAPAAPIPYPRDYLCWSIVSCLCCFWPLGLVAIIFSIKSRDEAASYQWDGAAYYGKIAFWLNVAAIMCGIFIVIIASSVAS